MAVPVHGRPAESSEIDSNASGVKKRGRAVRIADHLPHRVDAIGGITGRPEIGHHAVIVKEGIVRNSIGSPRITDDLALVVDGPGLAFITSEGAEVRDRRGRRDRARRYKQQYGPDAHTNGY